MAASTTDPTAEFETFAANLIASGEFANKQQVLQAAMDAFRRQRTDQAAYDEACVRAAEEGEASGLADGDIFEQVRAELGLKSRNHL
ncbi:MAG: hypothetical protein V4555_09065 [Acidobacteriota bacterium]